MRWQNVAKRGLGMQVTNKRKENASAFLSFVLKVFQFLFQRAATAIAENLPVPVEARSDANLLSFVKLKKHRLRT